MIDSLVSDNSLNSAKLALDGLALKRDVISQNMANVDTPGYQSQQVDFEAALKNALKEAPRLMLTATSTAHLASPSSSSNLPYKVSARQGGSQRADGNNVDIDRELTDLTETGIRYQALSQAVSNKISLLKTIAR